MVVVLCVGRANVGTKMREKINLGKPVNYTCYSHGDNRYSYIANPSLRRTRNSEHHMTFTHFLMFEHGLTYDQCKKLVGHLFPLIRATSLPVAIPMNVATVFGLMDTEDRVSLAGLTERIEELKFGDFTIYTPN